MQLSLTPPCSWALLLLILSNLLLWKSVASVPKCEVINGQCQLTLEHLLNRARGLSKNINHLTSEIFNEFDENYASGPVLSDKILRLCYKYSLRVPYKTVQDQEIQVLLNMTIGMLIGWNNTLMHVVADIADLESIPGVGAFISKVREIAAKFIRLSTVLKEVKSLLNLLHLEFEEDEDYLASSGLPFLHRLNNSYRLVFYHVLLTCLNYDGKRIAAHVKILRCKMVYRQC
ncbi:prolactin-5A1-like [Mastomys coucha]|uniref:prolactin-5A1-like n=1 Tax=Mastomys coucha TaxID=35658 RepID=UPI0012627910|nr:prolactin-5A1-like [Mastomys coucha]XP_031214275.1 prolactin-5A1-like [Mastomys coucha]XP_031214276.1 prolactin-5A1-like [Mastomys coucha]